MSTASARASDKGGSRAPASRPCGSSRSRRRPARPARRLRSRSTISAELGSLSRRCRIASSSSRAIAQRPERGAARMRCLDAYRHGSRGPRTVTVATRARGRSRPRHADKRRDRSSSLRCSGVSAMPLASAGRSDAAASASARARHRLLPGRRRHDLIDQPPVDARWAAHAFLGGAEHIGAVAPHLALVGQPRQPAGAGQHREQRQSPAATPPSGGRRSA